MQITITRENVIEKVSESRRWLQINYFLPPLHRENTTFGLPLLGLPPETNTLLIKASNIGGYHKQ